MFRFGSNYGAWVTKCATFQNTTLAVSKLALPGSPRNYLPRLIKFLKSKGRHYVVLDCARDRLLVDILEGPFATEIRNKTDI